MILSTLNCRITKALHDATGYKLYMTKKATTAEKFRQIRAAVAELELDGDWVCPLSSTFHQLLPGKVLIASLMSYDSPSSSSLDSRSSAARSRTPGSS